MFRAIQPLDQRAIAFDEHLAIQLRDEVEGGSHVVAGGLAQNAASSRAARELRPGRACSRPTMAVTTPASWMNLICRSKMFGLSLSKPRMKPAHYLDARLLDGLHRGEEVSLRFWPSHIQEGFPPAGVSMPTNIFLKPASTIRPEARGRRPHSVMPRS